MPSSSCVLWFCLLSVILLQNVTGVQQNPAELVDRPALRASAAFHRHPGGVRTGEELKAKLLRINHMMRLENDVVEPGRKRGFPGSNIPLDRLSVSPMENRQGRKKQSKVVGLPRRREIPPPISRIGMSRVPNSRG
nr:osteocrin [Nothobranchius furzeri]